HARRHRRGRSHGRARELGGACATHPGRAPGLVPGDRPRPSPVARRRPRRAPRGVPRLMECPSCRAALPSEARFCLQCGKAVSSEALPLPEGAGPPPPPPSRTLPEGLSIAQYKIAGVIGEGAMGVVYRASDSALGRMVALKALHANLLGDAGIR